MPKGVIRGQRWQYNRAPEITGVIDVIQIGGYVHVAIEDDGGEMTWISRLNEFLARWTRVEPQSDLDREVVMHIEQTRRVPLSGQRSFLK